MKRAVGLMKRGLCAALAALCLSACGCDDGADADIVVYNDSSQVVGSITLEYGRQTQETAEAGGRALLERGESLGLELEEDTQWVRVVLKDLQGRAIAQKDVDYSGERLYLILREGRVSVLREWMER